MTPFLWQLLRSERRTARSEVAAVPKMRRDSRAERWEMLREKGVESSAREAALKVPLSEEKGRGRAQGAVPASQ